MPDPNTVTKVLTYRHTVLVRVSHWLNVVAILVLLMSGLQIFNAHPALYWGQKSAFADPWLSMGAINRGGSTIGVTSIGGQTFDTTGLFGYSGKAGVREPRGFPAWATLPSYRTLADGRHWHFFFAWVFGLNGIFYLVGNLLNGHIRRDLLPARDQLTGKHLLHEIIEHIRLRFPKGEEARRYNAIQKMTYLAVIFGLLPLMILTGLTMSPAVDASQPWLVPLFGGRQSARSLHFICANLIVLFVLVHVALVIVVGFFNSMRSMITGRYTLHVERDAT